MSVQDVEILWTRFNRTFAPDHKYAPLINTCFANIQAAYNGEERHYHNLSHILQLLSLQEKYAEELQNNDVITFSIFFHDLVYNARKPDNEEKSAAAAVTYLNSIGYRAERTAMVRDFILATKTHHNIYKYTDLDYFLDFDLQILGTSPEAYRQYTQQIRQEYSIYPDLLYKPGRKKVLQHFLDMPAIFRTPVFREQYEDNARKNIRAEIDTL